MKTNPILGLLAAWLLTIATVGADPLDFTVDSLSPESLGSYNADISQSSVSGLSAGAYMADQFFLYPQAQKVAVVNPRGCYDWWGYLPGSTDTYATKQGPQMKAVYAMMERLAEGSPYGCPGTNQSPTIELAGDNFIELDKGVPLLLPVPEATALDPEDGDITANIIRTPAGPVDTGQQGTYELRYNVRDSEGCQAREMVRTIVVRGCEQWTAANTVLSKPPAYNFDVDKQKIIR